MQFEVSLTLQCVCKCSLCLTHLIGTVRGTKMHLKLSLRLGVYSRAQQARTSMAEQCLTSLWGSAIGVPKRQRPNIFGSRKQSRRCGRGGIMLIHAILIKHF